MLESLARSVEDMKNEVVSMGGKVEEIGTKVNDMEAQRLDPTPEVEKVVEARPDSKEVGPSRWSKGDAVARVSDSVRRESRVKVEVSYFGGILKPGELFD